MIDRSFDAQIHTTEHTDAADSDDDQNDNDGQAIDDDVSQDDEQDDEQHADDLEHLPAHRSSESLDDPRLDSESPGVSPETEPELPNPPEVVPPNRTRADTMQYGVCPASAYTIPGFGPLYLLDRGEASSCSIYLYPALYGLSRPILPRLPPRSNPQPGSNPLAGARRRLARSEHAGDTTPAASIRSDAGIASRARRLQGRPLSSHPDAALEDSDVAVGVLAAAVDLAAAEQLATETELQAVTGLRTDASTTQLPPDLSHWTHVQLHKVCTAVLCDCYISTPCPQASHASCGRLR